jgi:hypothetical protein
VRPVRRGRHLGEVVLARGTSQTGEAVLATPLALQVPDRDLRIPWDRVASATWDDPILRVVTTGPRETYELALHEEGQLPEVIRERVQASILVSEHVMLRGDSGARFSARREPAGDAEVRWTVTFDAGLDPQDADLRELAERALDRLRLTYGV